MDFIKIDASDIGQNEDVTYTWTLAKPKSASNKKHNLPWGTNLQEWWNHLKTKPNTGAHIDTNQQKTNNLDLERWGNVRFGSSWNWFTDGYFRSSPSIFENDRWKFWLNSLSVSLSECDNMQYHQCRKLNQEHRRANDIGFSHRWGQEARFRCWEMMVAVLVF